jgi:hypothetical protein
MKKLLFFFMPVIALSALPATSLYPHEPTVKISRPKSGENWSKLGERKVNATQETDEWVPDAPTPPITALKIRVNRGGLNLHRCIVYFADGDKASFDMRNDIPAGTESRVIGLGERGRSVTRFAFWYDTRNYSGQKPEIELWARP